MVIMKKLLFLCSISLFTLIGCSSSDKPKVPIEVHQLIDAGKVDTVYLVKTEEKNYYFDKNKQLIEVPTSSSITVADVLIWLSIILLFII